MSVLTDRPAGREREAVDRLLSRLATPSGQRDPYRIYRELHRYGPVQQTSVGYVVTGYRECAEALRRPELPAHDAKWLDAAVPGWWAHVSFGALMETLLGLNGQRHARVRAVLQPGFSRPRLAMLRSTIERETERGIDRIVQSVETTGRADVMALLARPLPAAAITALLGLHGDDLLELAPLFNDLARLIELVRPEESAERADIAAAAMLAYALRQIDEQRRTGRRGLIGLMLDAADRLDPALTHEELVANVALLLIAGFKTTVGLIGNAIWSLQQFPAQWELLRRDPSLAANAIDELARFDSSTQIIARYCDADMMLGQAAISGGQPVYLLNGAANRDPSYFDLPDELQITRTGVRSLSFGGGAHYCIGSVLARMELAAILTRLPQRLPELRVVDPPIRQLGVTFREFVALHVGRGAA